MVVQQGDWGWQSLPAKDKQPEIEQAHVRVWEWSTSNPYVKLKADSIKYVQKQRMMTERARNLHMQLYIQDRFQIWLDTPPSSIIWIFSDYQMESYFESLMKFGLSYNVFCHSSQNCICNVHFLIIIFSLALTVCCCTLFKNIVSGKVISWLLLDLIHIINSDSLYSIIKRC